MCSSQVVNGETKNSSSPSSSFPIFRGNDIDLVIADAEYCLLNSEAAVRIPSHVPAARHALSLCAGVSVFNSIRHMNVPVGETIAIQGVGGLGHLAIQYANKMGYRVVAISRRSKGKVCEGAGRARVYRLEEGRSGGRAAEAGRGVVGRFDSADGGGDQSVVEGVGNFGEVVDFVRSVYRPCLLVQCADECV